MTKSIVVNCIKLQFEMLSSAIVNCCVDFVLCKPLIYICIMFIDVKCLYLKIEIFYIIK